MGDAVAQRVLGQAYEHMGKMKIIKISRLLALFAGACLFNSGFIKAATIVAPSASLLDVSQAITAAANGDIVRIPPGNVTWASTLSLTKPITLQGAGTNSTVINRSGGAVIRVSLTVDRPIRITGIAFEHDYSASPTIQFNGRNHAGNGVPITQFRVDRCRFNRGKRAVNPDGYVYGVIDHCTFLNNDISMGYTGDNDMAWLRPQTPGTTNAVVIEDCAFVLNGNSSLGTLIYHQEGCRTVLRHCSFSATTSNPDPQFIECHGNDEGSDLRGQILFEIHDNTFHAARNNYRFGYFRGGSIIFFNNRYTCNQPMNTPFELTEEEAWSTGFAGGPIDTVWPARDQITNSFFWNNTVNGAPLRSPLPLGHQNDTIFIQEGRDYWMSAPSANNGRPAGVYASYRPLAYPHPRVAADDGLASTNPPTIDSSLSMAGMQGQPFNYIITAGNNPQSYQATPLPAGLTVSTNTGAITGVPQVNGTFDVQIRASNQYGSDSATLRITISPPAPVIEVSPNTLSFPEVAVGQFADLDFTVTNRGSGLLVGTALAAAPFSIVAGGSYSVPAGTATAVKVRFTPTQKGPASGSVRFTGGAGETNTAEGTAFPVLGWNFSAIAGFVTSPFGTNTGYVLQNVTTTGNPTASGAGRAVYGFEITQAGNYVIGAWVNAVDTGADSVYINIDSEPTDPTMIWDIPLTLGFERRIASWRGNGSPGVAEFVPKVFNLSAGLHKLIVRGREPNARLDRFEITREGGSSRPATPEEFHILSSAP